MVGLLLMAPAMAATLDLTVLERGTREPISGATVVLVGVGTQLTDERGAVRFEADDGSYPYRVESPDYALYLGQVELAGWAGEEVYLYAGGSDFEIVVEARTPSPHHSRQILDAERVEQTPGTIEDPVRLLQSLPGVSQTPEYSPSAGAISVRGASPNETRFYLDGVEIPYLYHYNQYSSVFHTGLLGELALYPSSFGSAYGNATGGIVDARSRRPDGTKVHGGASLNFVMAGGWITAPAGEKGTVSASARRSYVDFRSGEEGFTIWPRFFDYLARYDRDVNDHTTLSASVFGAGDAYERAVGASTNTPDYTLEDPLLGYDRRFHSLIFKAESERDAGESTTSLGLVQHDWDTTLGEQAQDSRERYALLRHDGVWAMGSQALAVGAEVKLTGMAIDAESDTQLPPGLVPEAPLIGQGTVEQEGTLLVAGAYVEPRVRRGGWLVQPGVRIQVGGLDQPLFDPRLSLRWTASDDLVFRAAAGQYSQVRPLQDRLLIQQQLDDYGIVGDIVSPTLNSTSYQGALGADWAVQGRWELGADIWGKRFFNVPVYDPQDYFNVEDGRAWGIELTSRYRIREVFFSWVSLMVGHAERGDAVFEFDQPFSANFVASWDFRPNWNAGVRYRVSSGQPYTPVIDGVYDGDTDSYSPQLGAVNSARLPTYQKLDVHLEREFVLPRWSLSLYAEAWYVPERSNGMYPIWSYDYSETELVSGPGFLPLLGGRARF